MPNDLERLAYLIKEQQAALDVIYKVCTTQSEKDLIISIYDEFTNILTSAQKLDSSKWNNNQQRNVSGEVFDILMQAKKKLDEIIVRKTTLLDDIDPQSELFKYVTTLPRIETRYFFDLEEIWGTAKDVSFNANAKTDGKDLKLLLNNFSALEKAIDKMQPLGQTLEFQLSLENLRFRLNQAKDVCAKSAKGDDVDIAYEVNLLQKALGSFKEKFPQANTKKEPVKSFVAAIQEFESITSKIQNYQQKPTHFKLFDHDGKHKENKEVRKQFKM